MPEMLDSKPDPADPYWQHRLALTPLREPNAQQWVVSAIEAAGTEPFFHFLALQGLQPLWREYLTQIDLPISLQAELAVLAEHARMTAVHQMLQRKVVARLADMLESEKIPWFLFKGADLREWLYPDPLLRIVSDVDLFVRPTDRDQVIEIARDIGLEPIVNPQTASHEIALLQDRVTLDLHWHLLRPGRAHPGLNEWLFAHREVHKDSPGLDPTASLLVMLVHPAVTKYVISPSSMLMHLVDQARLIADSNVDWTELHRILEWSATKTAAWSSLYLLGKLAGITAPNKFMGRIQPGTLHQHYLRRWIDRAWITRWFDRRWLVGGFFNLALQDSAADALLASYKRGRALKTSPSKADFQ